MTGDDLMEDESFRLCVLLLLAAGSSSFAAAIVANVSLVGSYCIGSSKNELEKTK